MHASYLNPAPAPRTRALARWGGVAGMGVLCAVTALSAVVTKGLTARHSAPALAAFDGARASGVEQPLDLGPIVDPTMPATQSEAPRGEAAPTQRPAATLDLDATVRYFDGRPVKPVRTITMTVTAYSPDARSCGNSADGITASLHAVETNAFRLVAADSKVLPLGSVISVPGYDGARLVPVLDRGGAIKGNRLDVLFPTHEAARAWGVRKVNVTVYDYADGGGNAWRKVRDSKQ